MPVEATALEEIDAAALGGRDGMARVAEAGRPILLRGLARAWPAVDAGLAGGAAALDYVRRYDGGQAAEYFSGDASLAGRYHYGDGPGGFNFDRAQMPVAEALARIADNVGTGVTGYMGSLRAESFFPGFAEDNVCPLLDPDILPRIWIGNRSTVACHYDTYDNIACVVAGRRRFTLYPPDAIGDLYVGPIDHTLSGQPISMAAGDPENGDAYPRFAAAQSRAASGALGPGDAIYIPKLWWHQVEALDSINILVNYWWDAFRAGPDSPHTAMLLSMISIAERPPAERAAWRAFFDHYVFRPDGHPLAHMPPEKHGVLGPLNENYGRIRTLVMRLLRGQ